MPREPGSGRRLARPTPWGDAGVTRIATPSPAPCRARPPARGARRRDHPASGPDSDGQGLDPRRPEIRRRLGCRREFMAARTALHSSMVQGGTYESDRHVKAPFQVPPSWLPASIELSTKLVACLAAKAKAVSGHSD